MKVSQKLILDVLGEFHPTSYLPENAAFQLETVQMLAAQTEKLDPEVLYVGTSSQLKLVKVAALRTVCVVCIGKQESFEKFLRRHAANLIVLPETADLAMVINRLYGTMDRLHRWSAALDHAILTGQSYQQLVDFGAKVFGENPIIFINASYNILGASLKSTPYNERVNTVLTNGYYPKETTDGLARMGYQAKGPLYTVPTRISPPNYMGCPLMVLSFHAGNGVFLGFVTVYFVKDQPLESQFELFSYFAGRIRDYYVQSLHNDMLTPTPLELFMSDLIDHTREDETYLIDRARVLRLPLDATYRLGVVQWDEFSLSQANYIMGRLRSSLKFPFFKALLFHQSVLMLLQGEISSLKVMDEMNESFGEFRELLRICGGHAGFSTTCDSLMKIDVAYRQAISAAKYGMRLNPEEQLCFYSRYYIYDLLDAYTGQYPLEQMFVQKLRLLENPEEGHYSNLTLLRNYLLTERSISATAKMMHMHRNSVIYRLGKIQEILGIDLGDPDVRLRLLISFKVLEMLAGHVEPLPPAGEPEITITHE